MTYGEVFLFLAIWFSLIICIFIFVALIIALIEKTAEWLKKGVSKMPIDISKAKEENKRWKPKKLEKYFYVHTNLGGVSYYNWEDDKLDKEHYENGNVFRTKEEAEKAFEKVKELLVSLHGDNVYSNNKESEGENE